MLKIQPQPRTLANQGIPGESGLPLIGHTWHFMRDCNRLFNDMVDKYGDVYYNHYAGRSVIHLLSPDANQFVLLDRDKNFSSKLAWELSLKQLFPNGLMLRDGDDHRHHRRLMGAPFKASSLSIYVEQMNPDVATAIRQWQNQPNFLFYPAIKTLTLDLAAKIFLGENLTSQSQSINQAFVDLVDAALVLIRKPMFGNKYQRGLEGRALLERYFRSRIPIKRASDAGDMFAEICRAQSDEGSSFTDQDIINHMIFLMMAAHDTTTSSLSSVCFALAKSPEWQQRLRDEITAIGEPELSYDNMAHFGSADLVLKEALRLYPPLPIIPRKAVQDCQFNGFNIAKGSHVLVSPSFTQRLASFWSNPNQFDPTRFADERREDRQHKYAWIPFGGGAHKCLGLKFAELQVKLVLFHLLQQYQLKVDDDYDMPYQATPIGKPRDNLPVQLIPLND